MKPIKSAKVQDILKQYYLGGITLLIEYFNDPKLRVYEDTWEHKIQELLSKKQYKSIETEINLIIYKYPIIKTTNEQKTDE